MHAQKADNTWMRDMWDSRNVTMKCDLPRGNKDFGAAFLEKMNDKLF
jgi:hypothetical protein